MAIMVYEVNIQTSAPDYGSDHGYQNTGVSTFKGIF
jgi:hypothetical protein